MIKLPSENIPKRLFLTGVPGSRWSGIAQEIEDAIDADCSDRTESRSYAHANFSGHVGAYFGTSMEFPAVLSETNLDKPFSLRHFETDKSRVLKSHEWAYMLETISIAFPKDWIVLVYRDNKSSFEWWKEAGGWNITYPNYDWYRDDKNMMREIQKQNDAILNFAIEHELTWHQHQAFSDVFTTVWQKVYES